MATCLICDRSSVGMDLCQDHFVLWRGSSEFTRDQYFGRFPSQREAVRFTSQRETAFVDFVTRTRLEEFNGQPVDVGVDAS